MKKDDIIKYFKKNYDSCWVELPDGTKRVLERLRVDEPIYKGSKLLRPFIKRAYGLTIVEHKINNEVSEKQYLTFDLEEPVSDFLNGADENNVKHGRPV